MIIRAFFLAIFLFTFLPAIPSFAQEDVLVSDSSSDVKKDKVTDFIEEYVRQSIINALLRNIGDIFSRTITLQKINIFTQVSFNAVNMAAMEVYKQKDMHKIIKNTYKESLDKALEEYDNGTSQEVIQGRIRSGVNTEIDKLTEEPVFKNIVQHYFKEAVIQHKKIIMMTVAQRQAQFLALQKSYQAIQKQIAIQMQKAMAQQMQQRLQAQQQYQDMQQNGVLSR